MGGKNSWRKWHTYIHVESFMRNESSNVEVEKQKIRSGRENGIFKGLHGVDNNWSREFKEKLEW